MKIQIDHHTLLRAHERGITDHEISDVIETGRDIPGRHGRRGRYKVYDFPGEWNGRRYAQKRVEVFFVEDGGVLVTVTAYAFYGEWED